MGSFLASHHMTIGRKPGAGTAATPGRPATADTRGDDPSIYLCSNLTLSYLCFCPDQQRMPVLECQHQRPVCA